MDRSTDPFLRDAPPDGVPSAPCPPGWTAEPVGVWDGRQQEIVFHPRRHDVLIVRGGIAPKVERALPSLGYAAAAETAGARMWVRDRLALLQRDLQRLQERPAPARTLERSF